MVAEGREESDCTSPSLLGLVVVPPARLGGADESDDELSTRSDRTWPFRPAEWHQEIP